MKHALLNNGPDSRETQKKDLGSGEAIGPSIATHEPQFDQAIADDQTAKPGVAQVLFCAEEVAKILGISTRSVWRLVAEGELPPPVHIGRTSKWFMSNIQTYLQKLRDQQDGKARKK